MPNKTGTSKTSPGKTGPNGSGPAKARARRPAQAKPAQDAPATTPNDPAQALDIPGAVAALCLWFPDTTTNPSHGFPDYKVRGKSFATFTVNHHGDGRVALLLAAPPGSQQRHVEDDPDCYFVPPYVGPRGWLGVRLDRDLPWTAVANRAREAWLHIAPASLAATLEPLPVFAAPTQPIDPEQFDPLSPPRIAAIVERVGELCLALPETSRGEQFGTPSWRAGKKTFCTLHRYRRRLQLSVWVGPDRQVALTFSPRYRIPPYTGGNGWIEFDLEDAQGVDDVPWHEVAGLIDTSYRHFAIKRMLDALDAAPPGSAQPVPPKAATSKARADRRASVRSRSLTKR